MKRVRVNTSKSYDVIIEKGILESAGELSRQVVGCGTAAIVTDDIVDALYGDALQKSLEKSGFRVIKHVFPNGEASKNAANFLSILDFLADNHMTRSDTVFALGGGVAGDIAGFAAASYMRGIGLVQIPTTLLAAVDSSVGGKTAINLREGKNLAGAFYHPDLVLCDYSLLSTLPREIFRDGCAEVIKYGIIADSGIFQMLKEPISSRLEEIISRCVEIKRDIVCEDEREGGLRKLLNFGHTIGHAIEKLSGYSVSHGSAVAAGMAAISRASFKKGICSGDCRDAIIEMIKSYDFETIIGFSADELFQVCMSDKKMSGDMITVIVPEKIGVCTLLDLAADELREFIRLGVES